MPPRSYRDWFAIVFISLTAFLSGYYSFFLRPHQALIQDDGAAKWEQRMQPVRDRLPNSVQEIGYVSDNDNNPFVLEYHLTQFALVPIVVRRGGDGHEWILVNMTTPQVYKVLEQYKVNGYEIEKFGSGIFLLHKINP